MTFRSDFTKKPQSSKYGQFQNHNFGHVIKWTNHTHKSKRISTYSSKHNFKNHNPGETYLENVSPSCWPDSLWSLVDSGSFSCGHKKRWMPHSTSCTTGFSLDKAPTIASLMLWDRGQSTQKYVSRCYRVKSMLPLLHIEKCTSIHVQKKEST